MEINGIPGKNTVGNLGDIIINSQTKDKYKCICIYNIEVNGITHTEYQWELLSDKSDAKSVNGYSIWVGTTEELNALTMRDSNTLYFEKDDE